MRRPAIALLMMAASACSLNFGGGGDDSPADAGSARSDARVIDGFPDAASSLCSADEGTANVSATSAAGGVSRYNRFFGGALWLTGPVAPAAAAGPPMVFYLVFANDSPVEAVTLSCCNSDDTTCCPLATLVATTEAITAGDEVGSHPVRFDKTNNNFSVMGAVTITDFVDPFASTPGFIAGTVSATSGNVSVSGTFANTFCSAYLWATI